MNAQDPRAAAGRGLAALRAEAALATTVEVQRAVARLLGAPGPVADAAVDAVAAAGLLGHGIALHALMLAARSGGDVEGALERLAEGADPPASWSDYEVRMAADEAGEEATVALGRAATAQGRLDAARPGGPVALAEALTGEGLPLVVAGPVAAHRHGLAIEPALVEQDWARMVALRAGGRVATPTHDDPVDAWCEETLAGADPLRPTEPEVAEHLVRDLWTWRGGVVTRSEAYLDPFAG